MTYVITDALYPALYIYYFVIVKRFLRQLLFPLSVIPKPSKAAHADIYAPASRLSVCKELPKLLTSFTVRNLWNCFGLAHFNKIFD